MANITAAEKAMRRRQILDLMPAEQSSIAWATGLSVATISRWVARLHSAGDIHISSWRRNPGGGDFVPKYSAGPGEDALCELVPLSNTERHRRMRERRREARAAATWAEVWGRLARPARQPLKLEQPCLETF